MSSPETPYTSPPAPATPETPYTSPPAPLAPAPAPLAPAPAPAPLAPAPAPLAPAPAPLAPAPAPLAPAPAPATSETPYTSPPPPWTPAKATSETPYKSPPAPLTPGPATPETPSTSSLAPLTSGNPPPSPSSGGKETGTSIELVVAGIVIGGIIVLVAVVVFVILRRRRIPPQGPKGICFVPQQWRSNAPPLLLIAPPGLIKFMYEELVTATNGFSTANFLGQGGFGDVHKGVFPNGKRVAVKQLKAGSMQGEREFQAEVEIISRVNHEHLVSLVGYCISGTQMMLVYEYVPNNTLKFHLHGKGRPTMSWETRIKIALGSAKGLAYLHDDCEPNIIHRDIKAENILLDNNFVAKVADFGLAKFFPDDVTHISTRVKGTFGYLDPEYVSSGKLTDKSDVYSFGVVLLELITGRRPIYKTQSSEKENLVVWARPLLKQALEGCNFGTLVDPRLQGYNSSEMDRMVACAVACVRQSGVLRPRMSQILQALEGNIPLDNLNEGIKPGDSTIYNQDEVQIMTLANTWSDEDMNFNKTALQSQEQSNSFVRVKK